MTVKRTRDRKTYSVRIDFGSAEGLEIYRETERVALAHKRRPVELLIELMRNYLNSDKKARKLDVLSNRGLIEYARVHYGVKLTRDSLIKYRKSHMREGRDYYSNLVSQRKRYVYRKARMDKFLLWLKEMREKRRTRAEIAEHFAPDQEWTTDASAIRRETKLEIKGEQKIVPMQRYEIEDYD